MSAVLHFLLSIILIAGLSIVTSSDRASILIRYVFQRLVIELILAWFFLNSDIGQGFLAGFAKFFDYLLVYAAAGTDFVFGGMMDANTIYLLLASIMSNYFCFRFNWHPATYQSAIAKLFKKDNSFVST